jgi:PilZ domain-containing protein
MQVVMNIERRREVRTTRDLDVEIKVLHPPDYVRTPATVTDESPDGLQLRLREALHPGTMLQIYMPEFITLGEVRYCKQNDDQFSVGVQLQAVFRLE